MNFKLLVAVIFIPLLSACTAQQVGDVAYSSLGSKECYDETGGQACNLDERTPDQKMMNGSPESLSNEDMEREADKIHKKNR